ncbi:hypothetical protein [Modestobacter sp. VKM Ac-2978]|uniref:hypothetical protein n=1 Tax=Modestobacter sp. VKM Ac-2978 TaxID=3004132 RepID=UPI0022AA7B90|nr:hypothetical protein [Modestobacter sp. VKM Ac-2978]MCZ2849586.1 hypothetical protein [Modestobacter sp. VKM Ac-2978]
MRLGTAVSAGTALVLAAALVWHGAYAGFSDTTVSRPLPTVSTGTLTLTDDDSAVRMFTATGLRPRATATRCIAVAAAGSPATVRLYGTGRSSTNGLAGQLDLTIAVGTGGGSGSCTGFQPSATAYTGTLAAFPTDGWTVGVGSWTSSGAAPTSRVYQIGYTLRASAPASTQNGTATLSLVWEARTR